MEEIRPFFCRPIGIEYGEEIHIQGHTAELDCLRRLQEQNKGLVFTEDYFYYLLEREGKNGDT